MKKVCFSPKYGFITLGMREKAMGMRWEGKKKGMEGKSAPSHFSKRSDAPLLTLLYTFTSFHSIASKATTTFKPKIVGGQSQFFSLFLPYPSLPLLLAPLFPLRSRAPQIQLGV